MAAIVNAANCGIAPGAAGAWLITKTGGSPSAADASAVSVASIAGDFVLRARALGGGTFFVGVAANPLADSAATSIDRALQISDGMGRPYDSGIAKPGTFAIAGFVWLRRTGGSLQYLNGPELASAEVRRTISLAGPVFFDSSLITIGTPLEVKFDAPGAFSAGKRRPRLSLGLAL